MKKQQEPLEPTTRTGGLLLVPIDPGAIEEVRSSGPSEELLSLVVTMFQALGDTTRVKILYALMRHPLCVRDLAILVHVSESAVSHQLRLLRDRRLVRQRRVGNIIYYSLDDEHLAVLFREAEYHADHVHQNIPHHPYVSIFEERSARRDQERL
ncbi:metalloregulator ArsR/SmtB family transcription factor [Ktedonobacter racemifer]|uniref:metalloregulator ArsR/SmtB family transcription factor n=1 Tax=Ktedonobacter racemifer TaxID=363277 RepID=UPI0012FAC95E|nr:metalloregulator ArsR/SmtB family transcription factor [Ktedonobacter racemifer]